MAKQRASCFCSVCDKVILEGEPYWSLDLNNETMKGGYVTVHKAEVIASYCSKECLLASNVDVPKWMIEEEGSED